MHEKCEGYHAFYPDRERNPQQFFSDVGYQGHEKCRYCDLHPGDIIDILRLYSQQDKAYLKKDDDDIFNCCGLDENPFLISLSKLFSSDKNPAGRKGSDQDGPVLIIAYSSSLR